MPQKLWISQVTASYFKEGRIYASLNGYRYDNFSPFLFVSEDFGTTWLPLGKDLPMEPVNVIKEDPKNENILYVGTDNGMYVSLDRGQTFMAWAGDLPRVPVHDIAIQERDNEMVLGTHGRSVYIAKIDLLQKLTPDVLRQKLALLDVTVPALQPFTQRRRGANTGPAPAIEIPYFVPASAVVTINIQSSKGIVLATLTDTAQKGINIARYDMKIKADAVALLEKEWGKKLSLPSTGNQYNLPAGDYIIEVGLPDGTKQSKKFSLKEATRQDVLEPDPFKEEEF
jgi:hypothetical protein